MADLDHPFKAEVQSIREKILGINPGITEQVKWNAPSFSYKEQYLVTFNLHARDRIHLVFHHPAIVSVQSDLLEGSYKDRRMVYFDGKGDAQAKLEALEAVLLELIGKIDQA
jgi:hypothetical protein